MGSSTAWKGDNTVNNLVQIRKHKMPLWNVITDLEMKDLVEYFDQYNPTIFTGTFSSNVSRK